MMMKKFRKIYVEITNICNMKCSFCPDTKRVKAVMALRDFEHVAMQIKSYTDYVYLHVKGEPLLHPELKEIIDICKKYNLYVNISTNGILIKDKVEILKGIRQINVSLHSFEKDDPQGLQEYLADVINSCEILAKSGVIVRYKLWNDKQGIDNNSIFQVLGVRYNLDISNMLCNKDIKLKDNVFLSIKAPFKWPNLLDDNKEEGTCYGLRRQIAILVDGTVVPCCVDNEGDINLGNIFSNNLEDILNTDKAKKIKMDFENNKCSHDLCKKCEYRMRVTQM